MATCFLEIGFPQISHSYAILCSALKEIRVIFRKPYETTSQYARKQVIRLIWENYASLAYLRFICYIIYVYNVYDLLMRQNGYNASMKPGYASTMAYYA